jgi:hypothetical protein
MHLDEIRLQQSYLIREALLGNGVLVRLSGRRGYRLFTLVDNADYEALTVSRWFLDSQGYAARKSRELGKRHIYLHRQLLKPMHPLEADHVNRMKLDNRRREPKSSYANDK